MTHRARYHGAHERIPLGPSAGVDLRSALGAGPARPGTAEPPGQDDRRGAGRGDLIGARSLCSLIRATGLRGPLLLVVTEGGLSAVSGDWRIDDVLLPTAGPDEIDARVRLTIARGAATEEPVRISASGLSIDDQSYSARLHGRPLDLTYKEFQLLHFLATHPSRVFTHERLLSEVWGYDYFGGTRTVDVHVRRLRAKPGDQEQIIGTVRNVGYRFNVDEDQPHPVPHG